MQLLSVQTANAKEHLLVTDSRAEAGQYRAEGGCVIGIDRAHDLETIDFPEAEAVILEEEDLSEAFARMIFCHFHGLSYIVAETERTIIRESRPQDYAALRELMEQQENAAALFHDPSAVTALQDKAGLEAYCHAAYRFFGYGMWSVVRKRDGQLIGWCGIYPGEKEGVRYPLELGYLIGEAYRAKGYAKEACLAICRYACEEIGAEGLTVWVKASNQAAVRLAGSLGFICEKKTADESGECLYQKAF